MYESQLFFTGVVLLISVLVYLTLAYLVKRARGSYPDNGEHFDSIKKMLKFLVGIFVLASLVFVWGVNIQGIWGTLTGLFALIAIGLFAVWSLLSNIVASILIFTSKPFRVKDTIEIFPENIKGKVKEIGLIFVTLEDENKNQFKIPNNLIFQKYIKISKK